MKRTSITLFCLALIPLAARAQQSVTLREGIVVDPTQPVAYVMAPDRGVAAVDLRTGAALWRSSAAAKPLALAGEILLCQVEDPGASGRLELVTLNVREGGSARSRSSVELPSGVRVAVGETLGGIFSSRGALQGGAVLVRWSWLPLPASGIDPDVSEGDLNRAKQKAEPTNGLLRVSPETGAITREARASAVPPTSAARILPAGERLAAAGTAGTQYESADGRSVLVSERTADDRTWDKYRWTVYDRETGRRIGEARSHLSFAPFVVRDSILVFETTPYSRASTDVEPAKLRGVSLDSGREAWSFAVREVVYRGPVPP